MFIRLLNQKKKRSMSEVESSESSMPDFTVVERGESDTEEGLTTEEKMKKFFRVYFERIKGKKGKLMNFPGWEIVFQSMSKQISFKKQIQKLSAFFR